MKPIASHYHLQFIIAAMMYSFFYQITSCHVIKTKPLHPKNVLVLKN